AVQRMSKAEDAADDAKKLAQRCKALEAQLRQTITKKEHHEIVLEFEDKTTRMEKTIANQDRKIAEQEKELVRTKAELQRTAALGKQFAEVAEKVAVLNKGVDAQGRTVDSLVTKISQGTVPAVVHQQSISKINDLEERISGMVSRSEYASLQTSYEEATKRVSGMVPSSEYEALKGRVQELESTITTTVPREQFESSEAKVKELEARLAEHVPQSTYDELVSKVVQLAAEATGGQPFAEEQAATAQYEPTEPEHPSPAEQGPGGQPAVPANPTPIQMEAKAEAPPAKPSAGSEESPEIREIGSQLAEIETDAITEAKPDDIAPVEESPPQTPPAEEAEVEVEAKLELAPSIKSGPAETGDSNSQST
ncbi:MAG: hypothetical protein OK452_11305, partial [Thaumarchaeota archaeon]|nr:hypothetical protein [Nitrososphaerota archaeon]